MALPFYPLVFGQVLTAGQWNALFDSKQDNLGYVPLNRAGGTMLGRLITTPPTAELSGFQLQEGADVTSPNNGDIWATAAGLFICIEGVVYPIAGGTITNNKILAKSADYTVLAADVATGRLTILASGNITITAPPALGGASAAPVITILNAGSGLIVISDGSNIVDSIPTPAGAHGQVGGFRNVLPNGTNSYSFGAG